MSIYLHVIGIGRFVWPGERKAVNEAEHRVRAMLGEFGEDPDRRGIAPQSLDRPRPTPGSPDHGSTHQEPPDTDADVARQVLRDTAEVAAVRGDVRTVIENLVADLARAHLLDDEKLEIKFRASLDSPRASAVQAAIARARLQTGLPTAAAQAEGGRSGESRGTDSE